jgi:hypothetical protein
MTPSESCAVPVNVTFNGASPDVGVPMQEATGGVFCGMDDGSSSKHPLEHNMLKMTTIPRDSAVFFNPITPKIFMSNNRKPFKKMFLQKKG